MRLIDADELKIVIRDNPYLMENLNDDNFECILDLIDNAPTVEAIPTELHEKIMDKVEGELLECQSHLRPQGEWKSADEIFITEDGLEQPYTRTVCSNCNQANTRGEVPYCPWCGADMRGE